MSGARIEQAERSQAVAELRGAELARLEILRDAIEPVLAQIPEDVEMFDIGLAPGQHPRLFIDMIAFVEMAHDKRQYRFVQDTRYGRVTLAESERLDVVTEAITSYIARRLVDREKALASSQRDPAGLEPPEPRAKTGKVDGPTEPPDAAARPRPRPLGWLGAAFRLLLEYLGIIALCILAWVLIRYGYASWSSMPR